MSQYRVGQEVMALVRGAWVYTGVVLCVSGKVNEYAEYYYTVGHGSAASVYPESDLMAA